MRVQCAITVPSRACRTTRVGADQMRKTARPLGVFSRLFLGTVAAAFPSVAGGRKRRFACFMDGRSQAQWAGPDGEQLS
jgi:hypothetical protein